MNFETIVIERLREYPHRKAAVIELQERIQYEREKMTSIKAINNDVPVKGGGTSTEDRYINSLTKIELCKTRLREALREVKSIERALSALSDEEHEILTLFFIEPTYNAAGVLSKKYNVDRSQVYRRRSQALRVVTMRLYGVVDA